MTEKDKNELIFKILASIEKKISELDEKMSILDQPMPFQDVFVETYLDAPIPISEEIYIKICDVLGKKEIDFMGLS
tara:strand:- start:145 stop:372 length:228 start_codon:yes stop_codon:yes gene_type:complete